MATEPAFLTSLTACSAPSIRWEALALSGGIVAAVTAVPMTSKNTPTEIMNNKKIRASQMLFIIFRKSSEPMPLNGKGGVVMDFGSNGSDDMFKDAVQVVVQMRKASTSLLQRKLRIGYSRAARIIEEMEEQGIIGPADGSRPREVLISSVDEISAGGDF